MVCEKSTELMMQYMDGKISDFDLMNLEKHIETCGHCKEDFEAYTAMLAEFQTMELAEAPEGFADAVMSKIEEIDIYSLPKIEKSRTLDNILFGIWGGFLVLFGISTMLLAFNEQIFEYLIENGAYGIANFLSPYVDFIGHLSYAASVWADGILYWISQNIAPYSLVFLAMFVVLAGIQLYISRKPRKLLRRKKLEN